MDIILDFHPTPSVLELFRDEMKKEFEVNCRRGLFGNYDIIQSRFNQNRAIVCIKDGKPIGFTTWQRWCKKEITIDLTWFLPSERSFFAAKRFINLVSKEFKRRRDLILKSKCITLNGLCLAHHYGFVIVENQYSYDEIRERFKYESGNVMFMEPVLTEKRFCEFETNN